MTESGLNDLIGDLLFAAYAAWVIGISLFAAAVVVWIAGEKVADAWKWLRR